MGQVIDMKGPPTSAQESGKVWGLLDTKDNLWLGDSEGPKLYSDYLLARISAQVQDVRLGQEPGRVVAQW